MKRVMIYSLILAALFFAPVESIEVGKLIPVELVSVYAENGQTVIQTDTENVGKGRTLQEALQNLKDTASGILYLDTARYLLISKEMQSVAEELRGVLKPHVRLCYSDVKPAEDTAAFLEVQGKLPKLKDWKKGLQLPVLSTYEDSFIFLKKVENNA